MKEFFMRGRDLGGDEELTVNLSKDQVKEKTRGWQLGETKAFQYEFIEREDGPLKRGVMYVWGVLISNN